MADDNIDNEADPIKASYDVYIKPHIGEDRQMYVLQFPNRDSRQLYSASQGSQPLKMRIKPQAGMVEMDVPMDAWHNYDRHKGVRWGMALKGSQVVKGGGTHGLPGGFGIGGALPARGRGRGGLLNENATHGLLMDFPGAVEREQVLVKQTLGGQAVPIEESTPQYMIGAFRKNQLHLTPVDQIVQMRPQFHHIDAATEQERASRVPANLGRQEVRAIHMSIKSNVDGEEENSDSMVERIAAAQAETWRNHQYIDEESEDAWGVFGESLFVGGVGAQEPGLKDDDLLAILPPLSSTLNNSEYLDSISAPSNPAKLSRSKQKRKKDGKGKGKETAGGDFESDASESDS